jgi:hypothetical protein
MCRCRCKGERESIVGLRLRLHCVLLALYSNSNRFSVPADYSLFSLEMLTPRFTTELWRKQTFDLLSRIAHEPTQFDELTQAYLSKIHQRNDLETARLYSQEIVNRILGRTAIFHWTGHCAFQLALPPVQNNVNCQIKDIFHEQIMIIYVWTYSDIHSRQMLPKIMAVDKRYGNAGVRHSIDEMTLIL